MFYLVAGVAILRLRKDTFVMRSTTRLTLSAVSISSEGTIVFVRRLINICIRFVLESCDVSINLCRCSETIRSCITCVHYV